MKIVGFDDFAPFPREEFDRLLDRARMKGELPFKTADDGRHIWILPLTFGRARLAIGDNVFLDDSW